MDEKDKVKIIENYRFLHEYVQGALPSLMPGLIEKKVFTQSIMDGINAEKTIHQQGIKLLNLLPTRGPLAWGHFIDTIKEIGDNFVVDCVDPGYVKKNVNDETPIDKNEKDPEYSDDEPENQSLDVQVIRCNSLLSGKDIYKNDTDPKGFALIINVVKFAANPEREGSSRDAIRLKNLYTQLGYEVIDKTNLKSREIMEFLKEVAENPRQKELCSCIITILSHGDENSIYGGDSEKVLLKAIYEKFDNKHCPLLQNKPKLFVIQACRGKKEDSGVEKPDSANVDVPPPERITETITLPVRSDMLIVNSTLPEYVSLRDPARGSRFIRAIISVLEKNAHEDHALDLFTKVNGRMKKYIGSSGMKQQSEFSSNLEKKFYFFPGLP